MQAPERRTGAASNPLPGAGAPESGKSTASTLPVVGVPKGGGALRSIGEKFTANPATGTGTIAVPLPMSEGRAGFTPSLSLGYDSGSGNGQFGLGWRLDVAAVSRKTDRGMPAYRDGAGLPQRTPGAAVPPPGEVADTFTLAGGEDLVPAQDIPTSRTVDGRGFHVTRYRSRVESAFTRVERWVAAATGEVHWRAITRDNVTTLYGRTEQSRVADPRDPSRVFSWLACETYDSLGNAAVYEYRAESEDGVDLGAPHEQGRVTADRTANRYLTRVRYGNLAPWPHPRRWLFELVLEYGPRKDPFSSYRGGFEVRTYRLCQRLLFFHHVTEPTLVRALELGYTVQDGLSFLTSIVSRGYDAGGSSRALPPLEFAYTRAELGDRVAALDEESLHNLPVGLSAAQGYRWVDLDGEGLSGVLSEQAGTWFYKSNRGNGRLGPVQPVRRHPAGPDLTGGRHELLDLDGDGHLDLVSLREPAPGFSERTEDGDWTPWRALAGRPTLDWQDPRLRFVDLNGDGHADVLAGGDEELTWYPSLGTGGFGGGHRVAGRPPVAFTDRTQLVQFADMSGDGLPDLVRVTNGEVCYWPNLGYGRFGAKVVLGGRWLDEPDQFDPRRVRLADVDGSGTSDLLYLHPDGVRLHANRSGNTLAPAGELPIPFPRIDQAVQVSVLDLLGTGTACLVWSSPLPGDARTQVRYVELMRAGKPHLMHEVRNNMGTRTEVEFAPSTRYYLADRAAGRPWATRVPFPVHVVSRVRTHDLIGRAVYTTRYAYHHGHYDGVEREFGGFGVVEQWDAEALDALSAADLPPVHTKSWFHTGAFLQERRLAHQYAHEYHGGGTPWPLTPDVAGLTAQEQRQACRALRGRVLREEVYADDGTPLAGLPYAVTSHEYATRLVQPGPADGGPAVFFPYRVRTREEHVERAAGDPRITDDLVLEVDEWGDVLRTVAIAHGRAGADPSLAGEDRAEQARTRVVETRYGFTNAVDEPDAYRTPLPCETTITELHGDGAGELPFADWDAAGPGRRVVEHTRSQFLRDDLSGPLPFGVLHSRGLPFETLRSAFPPGLVERLYGDRVDAEALRAAGYQQHGDTWWAPSGHALYGSLERALTRFFLPVGFRDPFGATTTVTYDRYHQLVESTTDAVGNVTRVENDYRALQPRLVVDANGNHTEVLHDAFGRVTATALRGKPGTAGDLGDTVEGIAADPDEDALRGYLADPHAHAHELLGHATTRVLYDPWAAVPVVATISRTTHVRDGGPVAVQQTLAYTDGMGREAQRKVQAERLPDGRPRWIGTGWTVYNNKGLPVRTYEPFFTGSHAFEFARAEGVSPVRFYDPLGRVVATLRPDGSYQKTVMDPWRVQTWDGNDTVALHPANDPDVAGFVADYLATTDWTTWYDAYHAGTPEQRAAAEQTLAHAGTPVRAWFDALGRTFVTVVHNRDTGGEQFHRTRVHHDVQGRPRRIVDPLGRTVSVLDYDQLGALVRRAGIDSGPGLVLHDVLGAPCLTWNARGFGFRTEYDALHRPLRSWVSGPGLGAGEREHQRTEYGEEQPDAAERNLRHRVFRRHDGAGVQTSDRYDAKGNLVSASRRLAAEYREVIDWSEPVDPDGGEYTGGTAFDAMDRPVALISPDGSVLRPAYNEAGLLERLDADLAPPEPDGGAAELLHVITNVDYNARGQRVAVRRGNGVHTTYDYDPATFRLVRVLTTRETGHETGHETGRGRERVQDLRHTYDPEGNPTAVVDAAQQRLFFRNRVVEPGGRYVYDALYRLVQASGREHLGQAGAVAPRARGPRPRRLHGNDAAALGRYSERYRYDPVGNLLEVRHTVTDPAVPGWTRRYRYAEPSLLEPDRPGNRLSSTGDGSTGDGTSGDGSTGDRHDFWYDEQGNTTSMPDVPVLVWDPEDRLRRTARRLEGGQQTWMAYDGTGQRVRKITDRHGARRRERIYLGPFELYREYGRDGAVTLERTSLHALDEDHRVALVETRTRGEDRGSRRLVRHQLEDNLGSVTVELDQDARLLGHEEYHPYGSTAYEAVSSRRETPKRYRYTGRERDDESGLRHHGARYYAPWLARWTSPDPAGTKDSLSPYVYVAGNPMRLVDPSGRAGEGRQLNFAETFTQEVMATRAGRGISSALRRDLRAMWAWWGGTGPIDAGHIGPPKGTPQAFLQAGQKGLVAAQPLAENRSLGQLVKVQAAARRLAGLFVRTAEGIDATVPAGSRFGRVARAAWRDSPNFRQWLKTFAKTGGIAKPPAGASAALTQASTLVTEAAEAAKQLDLPFGKTAQAVAKVEQTIASAAPAVEAAAQTVSKAAPAAEAVAETAGAVTKQAGTLAKVAGTASRVARAAAPVVQVVAKVAAPVALVASVAEAATAETQSEKAHAAVNVTASVAAVASSNPVTGIAAGSLAAGGYVGGKVEPIVTEATGSREVGVAAGTLAGAATGAAIGAAVGTIVPGVGTAVGAGVGAVAGAIGGFVTSYWN